MSTVLNTLKAEREKLDKAIAILEGGKTYTGKKRGRKPGKKAKKSTKRVMSPKARKAISKAQKARWAKQKREAKKQKQVAAPVAVSA